MLDDWDEPASKNTEANRRDYLKRLPYRIWVVGKGTRATISRTNSYSVASGEFDVTWGEMKYVLIWISIANGWARYHDEFWVDDAVLKAIAAAQAVAAPDPSVAAIPPAAGDPSASAACAAAPPAAPAAPAPSESAAAAAACPAADLCAEPLASKEKAKQAGKRMFNEAYRSGSANTLHAIARAMCDATAKTESRIITYVMKPQAIFLGKVLKHLRSPTEVRRIYSELAADWKWLDVCKEQLDILSNNRLLHRIGFVTTIPAKAAALLTIDSPEVSWDQTLARSLWNAVTRQIEYRSGTMMVYTLNCPGATAGLCHVDVRKRSATLDYLALCYRAVEKARAIGTPLLLDFCNGQGLRSGLMQWFFKSLRSTGFLRVGDVSQKFLDDLWGSLLNDKFTEDMLRVFREYETRANNHKQVPMLDIWEAATRTKLFETYERKEVISESAAAPPASLDIDSLFKYTYPDDKEASDEDAFDSNK